MRFNLNHSKNLYEVYPELAYLYSGINTTELRIELESIVRHVVWFYSKDNAEHNQYPKYEERFKVSLEINNIPKRYYENKEFNSIETEISFRYLMLQADTKFEVWVSLKKRLSIICKKLREEEEDTKWADQKSAGDTAKQLLELTPLVEDLEKSIFGDHENIKQFGIIKQMINSENYVQ